jgi:hypothetical protein
MLAATIRNLWMTPDGANFACVTESCGRKHEWRHLPSGGVRVVYNQREVRPSFRLMVEKIVQVRTEALLMPRIGFGIKLVDPIHNAVMIR